MKSSLSIAVGFLLMVVAYGRFRGERAAGNRPLRSARAGVYLTFGVALFGTDWWPTMQLPSERSWRFWPLSPPLSNAIVPSPSVDVRPELRIGSATGRTVSKSVDPLVFRVSWGRERRSRGPIGSECSAGGC